MLLQFNPDELVEFALEPHAQPYAPAFRHELVLRGRDEHRTLEIRVPLDGAMLRQLATRFVIACLE